MKSRIYGIIIRPVKKLLREEIDNYNYLIDRCKKSDVFCPYNDIYDVKTLIDKRNGALYILNRLCLKW